MKLRAQVVNCGSHSGHTVTLSGKGASLDAGHAARVALALHANRVAVYERQGDDLILVLTNGEWIRLNNFFRDDADGRPVLLLEKADCADADVEGADGRYIEIVFRDDHQGILQPILPEEACGRIADPTAPEDGGGLPDMALLPLALLGAGGAAAGVAAAGGGGNGGGAYPLAWFPPATPAAPVAPTLKASDANANGRPEATGTAEPGSTVTVTWPDGTKSTVKADASGHYTAEAPTVQSSGSVTATASSPTGGTPQTATATYTDTTAPSAPTLVLSDANANGLPEATGTAEPGSTVRVTWPDGSTSTTVANAVGAYTVEAPTVQASGSVTAQATDVNGNAGPTATATYTDTTAPSAPTLSVADANANGLPEATGTAEPGSTVRVTWPDGSTSTTVANATGAYTVEAPTVQASGPVTAQATDVNGNAGPTATATYTDTTAPSAPTLAVTDANANGLPEATGTAEPGSTVRVTWPDGSTSTTVANATGAYTVEAPTVQASGSVTAQETDVNGNVGPSATATYTDTTAPSAPTLSMTDANANGLPEATGAAEPGSTVRVTWPDGSTSTTVANAAGAYTVEAPTVQASGSVTAQATDVNGNAGPTATATYTDTTAPSAPTLTVADANANGLPEATGTAEPGSTVRVTWPDGSTSTTVANATGAYTVEAPTVQASGPVTAQATDVNGNAGPSATATYTDTTAPSAPTLSVMDANANGLPEATGTAEPGSTVRVTWPDGSTSTTVANATGAYTVEAPTVQASGPVTAQATDVNGNAGPTATATYTDTTAPSAPTLVLSDANANGLPEATGAAEPGSTVRVTWPDGSTSTTVTNAAGAYTVEAPTVQASGPVMAQATDVNGNAGPTATATYTDTTAPSAPTLAVADANANGLPEATGTAEPGSTVRVTWPDGSTSTTVANATGAYTVEAPTVQASGPVTAQATDVNGNAGLTATATYTDTTAPSAPTLVLSDANANGLPEATGAAEPGSTVRVTWPDGSTSTTVTNAAGAYTVEAPSVQASGPVTAQVTDVNGNVGPTATATYTDTTAPSAPTLSVTDANANGLPEATGAAEPGSTVRVTWPDGSTSTTVANATGAYTVEAPTVQASGPVTATATDVNGNAGPTATAIYTDTTAPSAPTLSVADANANGLPEATGTAEPGSTVRVTWPDGSTSTTVANAAGAYTVEAPTVQASGPVTAQATDVNGNAGPTATATYTDTTVPSAPTLSVMDVNANGLPEATGTAEPGSTVRVTWPDGSTSTTVANAVGAYTVEAPSVQASGSVTAQATDVNGNAGPTATATYTDTTAPSAPTLSVTDANANGLPEAAGTAEPGSTVKVTWPDGSISTTVANATGAYTVEAPTVQASGPVTAQATDVNGNAGPTATATYTDTTAPSAPTLAVTDANANGLPEATGAAEPGSTVRVTWPDGSTSTTVANAAGAYTVEAPTVQASGSVTAQATDVNGNAGPTATATYTDTTAPSAPTLTVADANANGLPEATGTAEPGSTVRVTWPDGSTSTTVANATGVYTVEAPTVQASGPVTAQATDVNGNVGPSATATYTDTTAPSAPTLSVADANANGLPEATGTAEPGSTVRVTWPDGSTSTTVANAAGAYTVEAPTVQASGPVTATATDVNGNAGPTATATYTDTTAPSAPTLSVTDANANGLPEAAGTAEPGSTVRVTWPDGSTSTTVANAAGAYTVEAPSVQASGPVTATATDVNGNAGPIATATYTDTTAPSAPTLTVTDANANGLPEATGTAEPGSTVRVTWPDGSSSTTVANAAGAYTVEAPTVQASGPVTAQATDVNGNAGPTATASYTDTTAPSAPTLSVSESSLTDDQPEAAGTAEPGCTVTVTWPDGSTSSLVADAAGNYAIQGPMAQASGPVSATATDVNGNVSAATTGAYTDTTPPSPAAIVSFTDNAGANQGVYSSGTPTDDTAPVLKGTLTDPLPPDEEVRIYEGATLLGTATVTGTSWSFALSGLSEGTHNYTVAVADVGGSQGAHSAAFSVVVDTTAPLTDLLIDLGTASDTGASATDNTTALSTPAVTVYIDGVNATDATAIEAGQATLSLWDDANNNDVIDAGERVFVNHYDFSAEFSGSSALVDFTLPSLPDGVYNLKGEVTDLAGNTKAGYLDSSTTSGNLLTIATGTFATANSAHSTQSLDGLGFASSPTGDFNGDGYTDYVVSSPHDHYGATVGQASDVYLVYGSANGLPSTSNIDGLPASQALHITAHGVSGDLNIQGLQVQGAGDLNGDGFGDLLITSNLNDSAFVIWGRAAATGTINLGSMETTATSDGFAINGVGSAWFGAAAGSVDLNNDGYSDLLLSDPHGFSAESSPAGTLTAGVLYVLYGHSGTGPSVWTDLYGNANGLYNAVTNTQLGAGAQTTIGTNDTAAVHFGGKVESVGDVNGDGILDFVVTDPRLGDVTALDTGAAYLVFGQQGGLASDVNITTLLSSGQAIRLEGSQAGEDLGGAQLDYGNNGSADALYSGEGNTVAALGDINGDGIGDFAIGSPEWGDGVADGFAPGRVYVLYGSQTGWTSGLIATEASGSAGFTLTSSLSTNTTNGWLGFDIRGAGDVNGDGVDDFLIGAPGIDAHGTDSGSAYLVYGAAGGGFASGDLETMVTAGTAVRLDGMAAGALLGTSTAVGDWNGDGIGDFSIGAWGADTGAGGFYSFLGSTSALTQSFTVGNDTLVARDATIGAAPIVNGVDRISGGLGNDTILGIGTDTTGTTAISILHDVAYGGQGNDAIHLAGLNFTRVDGGEGIDTLALDGSGLVLNLGAYGDRVQGFEKFDLGNGGNEIDIRLSDVLNEPESASTLGHIEIVGSTGSTVNLVDGGGAWSVANTQTVGSVTFDVYHNSALDAAHTFGDVWIQHGIVVV